MAARTHRIAVIPGDGIGKETVPEGLRVLDAAARRFGFDLELAHYDWSCETFKQTGRMMPEDGLDQLRRSDSIFLGAVGWPGVPDHVSLWGLLIPIRRQFDQYVNLRPCRLMPGVSWKPHSCGVSSASSRGQSAASTRPTTLLLPASSQAGKNSLQEITIPARPCVNASACPSQSQLRTSGLMCRPRASMYSSPRAFASVT